MTDLSRRKAIAVTGAALAALASAPARAAAKGRGAARPERLLPAQTAWDPPPPLRPEREGPVAVAGTQLWHQDTGGKGPVVVFLHANTGCYESWAYQQGVFAAAGYRVLTYSARGHFRSGRLDRSAPGSSTADLAALMDALGIRRAHIVGTAAGGLAAMDMALSRPARVLSLTVSSSHMGITDPDFAAQSRSMLPRGLYEAARTFSELGPSYRAANPDGVAAWEAIEKRARHDHSLRQTPETPISLARIAGLSVPSLFITGDADAIMPPSRMRQVARQAAGSTIVTVAEAGHSLHWEQPKAFNRAVLDFIGRHRGRA